MGHGSVRSLLRNPGPARGQVERALELDSPLCPSGPKVQRERQVRGSQVRVSRSTYRRRRRARRARRGRNRNARGSVAVEFLFAIPIVLFLFFGIFELGRHYYTRLTLRHAVAEAARFAVTGRTLDDPDTGNPMTRAESIQLVIQRSALRLGVDVAQIVIIPADGGGPEEVVQVGVQYEYAFWFQPMGDLLSPLEEIVVTTAMRNEPAF